MTIGQRMGDAKWSEILVGFLHYLECGKISDLNKVGCNKYVYSNPQTLKGLYKNV